MIKLKNIMDNSEDSEWKKYKLSLSKSKLKKYRAKIGTIPTPCVWLKEIPIVGKQIDFIDYGKDQWEHGIIDKIDSVTGFLFISRF